MPLGRFNFPGLVKPFLSRILPSSALFLQVPGVEWESQPPSCPTGIFSLIHSCHRAQEGSDTFLLLILTLGCCRAFLPLPFPLGAAGPHSAPKIRVFLLERRKGVPTLALPSLTQAGPFPWEAQTLSG